MNKFACGKSVLSKRKRGFTLSEVMIVLVIIGVITGILLPTAIQSTPDENVMKFKKGYSVLGQAIRELVSSDKYYKDGDLGIRFDGVDVKTLPKNYFCSTLADVINAKEVNCILVDKSGTQGTICLTSNTEFEGAMPIPSQKAEVTRETLTLNKDILDKACKKYAKNVGQEILAADGIAFFSSRPAIHFQSSFGNGLRAFSSPNQSPANYGDENGFDVCYKIFCMDVDGIHKNATETDCVNECPFGFGIRADGKILPGTRADEWINKSVQKEE